MASKKGKEINDEALDALSTVLELVEDLKELILELMEEIDS